MIKRIQIPVPIHIKKFIEGEYVQQIDKKGYCRIDKRSHLGKLITFVSKVDPFPKRYEPPKNATTLNLAYYDKSYSTYFPVDKIDDFNVLLEDYFKQSLICEVRAIHAKSNQENYSEFVRSFILRYGIVPDVDVDFETIRKIYRDYQAKIHKNFHRNIIKTFP